MSQPFDRCDKETTSDIWLTPLQLTQSLGQFDLDPCAAPSPRPWSHAHTNYDITQGQDGLLLPWKGRVWCNPPFSTADAWIAKMKQHHHGILLLGVAAETDRWMKKIWMDAAAILLVSPRVAFLMPDGNKPKNGPTKQTALITYSQADYRALLESNLRGVLLRDWQVKQ